MAIRLARQSIRNRSFEPFVGAVAVVDGHAVGHGFADANQGQGAALKAIEETGSRAGEATLYSNIEPCLDSPDFDACFKRLIRFHPRRIVIGAVSDSETGAPDRDPAGKEVAEQLRRAAIEAGIEVDTGVCANECVELNEVYSKFRQTGLPFVTVKAASTLDGRIATATGDSQWISGERSLRLAHELRRDHDAVLVGIGTVLKDDPKLTVRLVKGADPLRVVVDSKLRIPHTASLLADGAARKTTIATTNQSDPAKAERLREIGAEVLVLPSVHCLASPANNGESVGVDLNALLTELGGRSIGSVLVEGGSGIITSLLRTRQVDRIVLAIAPKIIGRGIEAIGDLKIDRLRDALTFSSLKTRKLGDDVIFDGRLSHPK